MKKSNTVILMFFIFFVSCSGVSGSDRFEARNDQNNSISVPDIVTKDYTKDLDKDDIRHLWFQIKDLNGDGVPEIIYFSSGACGNTGCTGSIYTKKDGGYCYAGDIHEDDIQKHNEGKLECFLGGKGILRLNQE